MVKLLRLTSTNRNDASDEIGLVFNVNMDAELIISENSQIGVKNLTFDDDFETLVIGGATLPIITSFESARDTIIRNLTSATYTASNYLSFFADMRITLNTGLKVLTNTAGVTTAGQGFYGQYFIDIDADKKAIQFRLSPAICPVVNRGLESADATEWVQRQDLMKISTSIANIETVYIAYDETVPEADLRPVEMCNVYQILGGVATNLRVNYISSTSSAVQWSRGSAVWWCRVQDLQSNGGAQDTNGFEIGLATEDIIATNATPGGVVQDSSIMFSIRCERPTDDYKFIVPDAAFTPVSPLAYSTATGISVSTPSTDPGENDVLVLTRETTNSFDRPIIAGRIFRNGLVVHEIFRYSIPAGSEETALYPYLCMFGAGSDAVAGQPTCTFDPYAIDALGEGSYETLLKPEFGNKFCGVSCFDTVDLSSNAGLPALDEAWYDTKGASAGSNLVIDKQVLKFMGFGASIVGGPGAGGSAVLPFAVNTSLYPYGFSLIPSSVFQIAKSDNYVVVIDSNKVKSYDCSEQNPNNRDVVGKRANILATIPVNNNTGLVEFAANEVEYIDFDNNAPITIRNLRLRVLDKSLSPINTSGISVMTLLIKDN